MVQLEENEFHVCFNCDAEFSVTPSVDYDEEIQFCPYCGSELSIEDDEDDDEDDDDGFDDYDDVYKY